MGLPALSFGGEMRPPGDMRHGWWTALAHAALIIAAPFACGLLVWMGVVVARWLMK